jgi:hypothetical protein
VDDSKHDRDCNFSEGHVTAPGRSAEQGNLLKAKDDLQKVRLQCLLFAIGDMGA